MQIAILAGGLATRLRPITKTIPKSMIPIGEKPFLQCQIELLRSHGIQEIVLCVGHLWEQIHSYFGDGSPFGVRLRYSVEEGTLLGTAGALKKASPLLEERFLLTYGDSYLLYPYAEVMREAADSPALMVVYHNQGLYDASNVAIEGDRVVRYEKGSSSAGLKYIDAGLLALRRSLLDTLPGDRPSSLDRDLLPRLVQSRQLKAYVTEQRFYEIGSPAGLEEFRRLYSGGTLRV